MRAKPPAGAESAPPDTALNVTPVPVAPPEPPEPTLGTDAAAPNGAAAPMPDCVPPEPASKPKSKPKPRPKPERKEAPPQLPTAPTVAGTPAGGVVEAQVRPMAVPVMSILGKQVKGPKGEDLGRVVDVLADASGRVRIAIIDFGGFLGVGDRRIAVDWPLLRFNPDGGDPSLLLSVERDKLKAAPEYKQNPRPETLMEPEASATAPPPAATAATATPADAKK